MKTRSATLLPTFIIGALLVFLLVYRFVRQNWRLVSKIAVATFLVSLLLSTSLAYTGTGALTETRKSALVKAISQSQDENSGYFPIIAPHSGANDFNTAKALSIMVMLNATDYIDVDKALQYLSSTQYNNSTGVGGFGARFDNGSFVGCDLYSTYYMVEVLSKYDSLNRINETSLMDFIVNRYSDTIGAFYEPVTEVDGRQYASSTFPMVFRSFMSHIAYAMPNIITTYAGICALKELGKLDLINVTKVFEWIMHCQAENGMFMPYPDADYMPLPDWSPLKTNPFEVDRYDTGIPYTFAAISALKALGRLDAVTAEARQKIRDYIPSCQINSTGMSGLISIHQDYYYPHPSFTYETLMTLYYLGLLNEAQDTVAKIVGYFQRIQTLDLDGSWPIPYPCDYYDSQTAERYGLHYGDTGPPTDSYYAIAVFNATGSMHLLDQPTPRVLWTWLNLIELSALITVITTVVLLVALKIQNLRQKKALEVKPA